SRYLLQQTIRFALDPRDLVHHVLRERAHVSCCPETRGSMPLSVPPQKERSPEPYGLSFRTRPYRFWKCHSFGRSSAGVPGRRTPRKSSDWLADSYRGVLCRLDNLDLFPW